MYKLTGLNYSPGGKWIWKENIFHAKIIRITIFSLEKKIRKMKRNVKLTNPIRGGEIRRVTFAVKSSRYIYTIQDKPTTLYSF